MYAVYYSNICTIYKIMLYVSLPCVAVAQNGSHSSCVDSVLFLIYEIAVFRTNEITKLRVENGRMCEFLITLPIWQSITQLTQNVLSARVLLNFAKEVNYEKNLYLAQ